VVITVQIYLLWTATLDLNTVSIAEVEEGADRVELAVLLSFVAAGVLISTLPAIRGHSRRVLRRLEAAVREPDLRFKQVRRLGSFGRVLDRLMDRQEYRYRLLQGRIETQRELLVHVVEHFPRPILVVDAARRVLAINQPMRDAIEEQRRELQLDRLDIRPGYGELVRRIFDESGVAAVTIAGKHFSATGILGWFPEREQYDRVWHGLQYVVIGTESFGGFDEEDRKKIGRPGAPTPAPQGWRKLLDSLGRRLSGRR
jgi:hypothetical protein